MSGILDLYRAMDDLTYQIDVSDSFDSGNGSDYDEEDTEAEASRTEDIDITVCHLCSQVVCKVSPERITPLRNDSLSFDLRRTWSTA